MSLPMIMANDADVRHPRFNFGRERSVDALIIPFINLWEWLCGLRVVQPT